MPMFTFVCQDCDAPFEEWVPVSAMIKDIVCPDCHSQNVKKQLSRIAGVKGGVGASIGTATTSASCNSGGT